MKRVFVWTLRILCLVAIAAAGFTVFQCVQHMNDDHSYEAVMGHSPYVLEETIGQSQELAETAEPEQSPEAEVVQAEMEPTITLTVDGIATMESPAVEVTATVTDIDGSIQARTLWYLDGALLDSGSSVELKDGDTLTYTVEVDVANAVEDDAVVELMLEYDGKTISGGTVFQVERAQQVEIRTEEITVTCIEDCSIYSDSSFQQDTGKIMRKGDTGLLLAYDSNGSLDALNLQFPDGTAGWVSARRNQITTENCTTTEDYTQEQKESFVNAMGYESATRYLVWVNLYTQKVNVFRGEKGSWRLDQCFPCATGVNTTPTSTGVFAISSLTGHWDLGDGTYVEPVLTFNGGEAFISQPKSTATGEVVDSTIGEPASGGGVRMLDDDIQWMSEHMSLDTMVVVY